MWTFQCDLAPLPNTKLKIPGYVSETSSIRLKERFKFSMQCH